MTSIKTSGNIAARPKLDVEALVMRVGVLLAFLFLILFVIWPLYSMLIKSVENKDGEFIGLQNYAEYFSTPALTYSIQNSLSVALIATLVVSLVAFIYAYALTRTCLPAKGFFRLIALVPLLAPSLLPAISFVYMFGKKGYLNSLLMGESIYGPIGVTLGSCFWTFPHALLIMITALSISDGRLYEAATALRATRLRKFLTVTLPGAKYGVVSAMFVVFTLVFTDFGVPKVIGGKFNVLATDIYKQVVGQQNFSMGAVVSVVLLLPAIIAFAVDRLVQRKQVALLSARAVPYVPQPSRGRDRLALIFCCIVSFLILSVLGTALFASLVTFWPYNLALTLDNYNFDVMDGGGWEAWGNSVRMALYVMVFGTGLIFTVAYLIEKVRGFALGRQILQLIAMIPLAVPGLVLGLSYIFFFNNPENPLNFLYGSMAILVLVTIAHFYTVAHLTGVTALKQMDAEFESVSASLKVRFWRTYFRVTLPVCQPALLSMGAYLFLNAMTTVSAVIFLYSPRTTLASVAVVNMDDAGDIAPAAAMAMVIVFTNLVFILIYAGISGFAGRRSQAWRTS